MCRVLPFGLLVMLAATGVALAKPRVAIAPIQGDKGGAVGSAIAEALADDTKIIARDNVADTMDRLGMSGELVPFDREKLQGKLNATALIEGRISKLDGRPTLKLTVTSKEKSATVTIRYTNPRSDVFRDKVRVAVGKKLGLEAAPAARHHDDEDAEPEAEDDAPKKRKHATIVDDDEDADAPKAKKKKRLDAEAADAEDQPKPKAKQKRALADDADDEADKPKAKKKRVVTDDGADEDTDKPKAKKKRAVAEDDDEAEADKPKAKKKKRVADDEDAGEPRDDGPATKKRSATLAALRVDGGASYSARQLKYQASGGMTAPPPRVGTASPGGRIEAELYPFAFSEPHSKAAGVGLVGEYDKAFGLAIAIPGMNTQAPIDQSHYSIGAQYRLAAAGGAFAFGLRYAGRRYIADRSGLAAPTDLDMSDVRYRAVSPTLAARFPVTSTIAAFGEGDALLISATGPIQKNDQYGAARVFGFEAGGGVDVALGQKFTLRFEGELSQIVLKFTGSGALAMARGVKAATDRTIDAVATLAVTY